MRADTSISEVEYLGVLNLCRMLAQAVHDNDVLKSIPTAIEAAERSDSLAPFVDPTLWMQGHAPLRRDIALMRAVLDFQSAVERAGK